MFVEQITQEQALELATKGIEVLMLAPSRSDDSWDAMRPSTLQSLLNGAMFFRREPAMEQPIVESEKPEPKKRKPVDTGKLLALRKAGWSMKKIAEELGISETSVWNYLQKMEE